MKDKTLSVVICLESEGELLLVGGTDPKIEQRKAVTVYNELAGEGVANITYSG